jgi:phosphoribosylformimino-5-aminoimidazole carboxamide ribotide isomerase
MRFRPCIDLHNGRVKQIVGSTLESGTVHENFVSQNGAGFYASMFARDGLYGGHIIMLGPGNESEAFSALRAFPGGLQAGGGINANNAKFYLDRGASHVIVTSAIFSGNELDMGALKALGKITGVNRLVLDLSCVKTDGEYFVAKDRWKTVTGICLNPALLSSLEKYCDEFLVHAASVEGRKSGADEELVALLSEYASSGKNPVTYAGGLASLDDISRFSEISGGSLDFTVGSALDIYGGTVPYRELAKLK